MTQMKSFFTKILVYQVIAVIVALIVVAVITRVSLNRGFRDFLQTQETAVLEAGVPVLAEIYELNGSWQPLRNNPERWQRIWRSSRVQQELTPPGGPRLRPGPGKTSRPPPPPREPRAARWMRAADRGMLRERLFLLDGQHKRVAGARVHATQGPGLQAIEVEGEIVGWIGFEPAGKLLPPEAQRFLRGQIQITAIALAVALVVAVALSLLLARHLSRPVRQLDKTVNHLSQGDYEARATISTLDETGRLAGHINQLAETLEKNRSARRRWMADIAHELRTPVAILKGEVEALSDGVRPVNERMTHSLREEIEHLSSLIDDLQTLALSDAGALNIQKEKVDLQQLVQQCSEAFRDRLARRRINLQITTENQEVNVDPQRMRQLIQNLLENTSRYVEEGGLVSVHQCAVNGGFELVVEDSGPGLTEKQISCLFERFYRVDESRSRAGGGAGLGLSICRNIAEAHSGRIEAVRSELGGLKIHVEVPG
jgi:two-component system sensor histidine kinase BaeS